MDHLRAFAAHCFKNTGLSSFSVHAIPTFIQQNFILSHIIIYVAFTSVFRTSLWLFKPKKKLQVPNGRALPAQPCEPESMFPPGMQIDNVIKKWASTGKGGASQKGNQKQH